MSLKGKMEAVIYASEEPVTLAQLAGLLGEEAQAELEAMRERQGDLPLGDMPLGEDEELARDVADAGSESARDAGGMTSASVGEAAPFAGEAPATLEAQGDVVLAEESESSADVETGAKPEERERERRAARERERQVREHLRRIVEVLMQEYAEGDRGIEVREVAGGFRMGTKPEYHDAVRGFAKNLKPALKLTLQALETLAVVAYKQPVTAAEISEIRGVDSAGVLGGLMGRKLIATAGRKQVIGRPMLYKTTKEFLIRFGLKDVQELPSMEEFERMAGELQEQEDLPMETTAVVIERANVRGDVDHLRAAHETDGDEVVGPEEEQG